MTEHKDLEARLAEIEAYVEAGTPGEWYNDGYDNTPGDEGYWIVGPKNGGVDEHSVAVTLPHLYSHERAKANAECIVGMHRDLPALLAVARAAAALLYDAPWIPESTQVRPYAERVHLALAALGGQGQEEAE